MTSVDVIRFAGGALRGHRLRTGLSLLGVAVGVMSVMVLTSLGEGARIVRHGLDDLHRLDPDLLGPRKHDEPDRDRDDRERRDDDENPLVLHGADKGAAGAKCQSRGG